MFSNVQCIPRKPLLSASSKWRQFRHGTCLPRAAQVLVDSPKESLTTKIFKEIDDRGAEGKQASGAGGSTTYTALKRADAAWLDLRTRKVFGPRPEFVRETNDPLPAAPEFDVVVCGGTLGIFLACSLQLRGLRVAVVERGKVQGREQEWNISRKELEELVELGVLSTEEVEECITSEFNPVRAAFHGTPDVWTQNVLNMGVRPDKLIERVRGRFEAKGGCIFESTPLSGIWVHPEGASLDIAGTASAAGGSAGGPDAKQGPVTARLVLDCMGNASPIVRQLRHGQKPDGVCLVVGTCARGFENNSTGDIICTLGPSQPPSSASSAATSSPASDASDQRQLPPSNLQYFWEAFPAGSGPTDRTTYMFTYLDAHPDRPSLEAVLEDYWRLMPEYQGVKLEELEVQRVLFGCFPTYRDSPLRPGFNRVLQVGDSSGIQSPLSFGGFGALTRHLPRLTNAVTEALAVDLLDRNTLALMNAYNPGLSGAWMLQRAMSIPATTQKYNQNFINRLLGGNFQGMAKLGDETLKPFLQDVIQFKPLGQTMLKQLTADILFVPQIFGRVGPVAILDWTQHFIALGLYTALDRMAETSRWKGWVETLPAKPKFLMHRAMDNWKYGSGADYRNDGHH